MNHSTEYAEPKPIGWPTAALFGLLFLVCAAVGAAGAYGTYSNAHVVFRNSGTAVALVAGGEGVVLVLGVAMLGLTMIQRPYPVALRAGLVLMPAAAAVAGAVIAPDATHAVAYALSPMAMTAAAELSGLLSRSIVVRLTGVDAEAMRRSADATRRLAYHRARAISHPSPWARRWSERAAWRLAAQVGKGDVRLGMGLVDVQRERLTVAADDSLASMFSPQPVAALPPGESRGVGGERSESIGAVVGESAGQVGESSEDDEPVAPGSQVAYAVTLLADTPPAWDGLSLREAVARADSLVPGLDAKMLSATLREVGIEASAASIRSTRSALRRAAKADV